ncbi:TPA: hypothetical protein QHL53_002504 [Proteus mirabilis]|nr:hypothetical protein [Proteus mirabilis]
MAITAYIGINGSGKSYECVSNVIINGVLAGRRVVTNIVGIQPDLIREYCIKEKKADESTLGFVVGVTDEQCLDEEFLPYKSSDGKCTVNTFCLAGDLIVLDELWRLFGSGKKLTQKQESFFAEHRHFSHEQTGVSCDFAFMTQELSGISRFIRERIDKTFRMKKLNAIGMNKNYRVDVYDGHKIFKSALISSYHAKYHAKVFPLYKSHDNGNGVEMVVDKRQSLLSKQFFIIRLVIPLICLAIGGYLAFNYFTQKGRVTPVSTSEETVTTRPNQAELDSYKRLTQSDATQRYQDTALSSEYRIAGRLSRRGRDYIILQSNTGRLRFEPASLFVEEDGFISGVIDGQNVSLFSGTK